MRHWKLTILITVIALLGLAAPVSADSGTVTVTGTNAATFSLSLDTSTAAFGTALSPDGSGAGTGVTGYQDSSNGAYFVEDGSAASFAVVATIKSNKAWSGSVSAAENTGTASMTVGGGSLRWSLGDMGSLATAQGDTAFATAADATVWNAASSCSSGSTKNAGVCTYNFDYSLRVLWTDAPGTFSSTVTYSAAQT